MKSLGTTMPRGDTVIEDASTSRACLPAVAWARIVPALLTAAVLLSVMSTRYDYHRDELYFRILKPSWGYEDQPPLTPLLAHAALWVFGDSLWAMRIPATICFVLATVVCVLTTREFGGGRTAQTLSAWLFAFSTVPMAFGHILLTATPDLVIWGATLLFTVRALVRSEPRWWLAVGLAVGVGTYNKYLILLLILAVGLALLAMGPRSVLRSRWLWIGAGLAVVVASPNLIYQVNHHWPQLTMTRSISQVKGPSARVQLLPFQLLLLGPPLVLVWVAGFVASLRRPQWRAARAVAVAYPIALGIVLVTGGQIYYALGMLNFLLAAGCVPVADWMTCGARGRRMLITLAVVGNALSTVVMSLPLVPLDSLGKTPIPDLNQATRDEVGWPVYVREIAAVYASLPAGERAQTVIIAANYAEAGAIDRYGGTYHLPAVYSGHNQLYFYGPPPVSAITVVAVGTTLSFDRAHFATCAEAATLDDGVGVDNEEQGRVVAVCRGPRTAWSELWPAFRHDD